MLEKKGVKPWVRGNVSAGLYMPVSAARRQYREADFECVQSTKGQK